jgi:uncharacterized membrane protein
VTGHAPGHGHAHAHGGHGDGLDLGDGLARGVTWVVGVLAAVTLIGLVVWWPRNVPPTGASVSALRATVDAVDAVPCSGGDPRTCQRVTSVLDGGAFEGERARFEVPEGFAGLDFEAGDRILVDQIPVDGGGFTYVFTEFQRSGPMWWLLALFVIAVVALGRWKGVGALAGLLASFGVLLWFLVPSLIAGNPVVPVAFVAALAVGFVALYLAHGWSMRTHVALIGTTGALVVTLALAGLFVGLTNLTGGSDDEALVVVSNVEGLSLTGLVLAGMVIGALGVLDDVTVTQVSAVWELKRANAHMSARDLFAAGIRIGRDHVSSTVNTLVIAYAGASLPLLLLFRDSGRPLSQVLSQEVVAVEVVRALVGSIGLISAVPITTALAAALAVRSSGNDP